jgi:hypothetical protein
MTHQTDPTEFIYIPLRADLYAELIKRSGQSNVHIYVQNQVESFLDTTEGDPMIWSAEYIERHAEAEGARFIAKYGNPSRGYQWQNVYLPNGTQIRMTYRGEATYGEIRKEKLFSGKDSLSPSEFARRVASNTSRNAWRDIYIKFPGDGGWKFADDLRRQKK